MDLLVLILVLTVVFQATAAPMAVLVKEELGAARARQKMAGLGPLGVVTFLTGWVVVAVWFLYAWQTGQWLFAAIPAVSAIGGLIFRALARAGMSDRSRA